MRNSDVSSFGVLQGVKVLSTGVAYAGPFIATLMGEVGTNVIHTENPKGALPILGLADTDGILDELRV
jgi:crotonobetainyl-CoA:carnitine CoA-transferase CaiB-like acyl-CoA transferase